VAGLDDDTIGRYREYRRRAELEDDYILSDRGGRRGANAGDVEAAVVGAARNAVVLKVEDQLMINAGVEVSLAEKRVILPLLLHFLRHPNEAFTMRALSIQVWGAPDAKKTMQTKVKVAISRLRGLLGKDRQYIVTTRVSEGEDGASVVAYGLAPDFPYLVVERVEDPDAV
jgi:DNA-binding response OmpR family regulator